MPAAMGQDIVPTKATHAGWAAKFAARLALLAAALLVLWHVVVWLRDGVWPGYETAAALADSGFGHPSVPWIGAQLAIDWVLAWSPAGLLTFLTIILYIVGGLLTDGYDTRVEARAKAFGPAANGPTGAAPAPLAEAAERERQAAEDRARSRDL